MGKQTYIQPLIKKSASEKNPGSNLSMAESMKPVSDGHAVQTRHAKRTFKPTISGTGAPAAGGIPDPPPFPMP